MFKKLKSLGGGGKGRSKFRLDVTVAALEGLPEQYDKCRVVWARQAKVSVTQTVPASGGQAVFNEELSQIATLTRDGRGGYDAKEYQFKLQAPERGNQQKYVTLGKASLDMARFAGDSPSRPQSVKLQMQLPQHRTATLSVMVASAPVKAQGFEDDDITSVVTGGSELSGIEQDLSGFGDGDSRRGSGLGTPLQRVTEETEMTAPLSPAQVALSKEMEERDAAVQRLEAELAAAQERAAAAEAAQAARAAELAAENERLQHELQGLRGAAGATAASVADADAPAAAAPDGGAAWAAAAEQVAALQQRNQRLEEEVAALKAAAAAAGAAGVAGGAASAAAATGPSSSSTAAAELAAAQQRVAELEAQLALQLEKSDSALLSGADGIQRLQHELQDAHSTIAALQEELSVAKSASALSAQNSALAAAGAAPAADAAAAAAGGGVSPEVSAKLALYEEKIQQLVALVEEAEARPQSDREAELEARLREAEEQLAVLEAGGDVEGGGLVVQRLEHAEQELAEAENMATEAMNLLEAAQEENRVLAEELHQLKMDMDWQAKKAAKEKADWEARMQDGFRRVEESVLLAERLRKEKEEVQARCDMLAADRDALEAQLDPSARDEQVAAEVTRARLAAEAQARIEVDALQARIREMEEFVEKADAGRLEMAAKVSELAAQLAAVKREEQDSFDQVKTAEERADGLMLELQVLQHEKARLEGELALAAQQAERGAGDARAEALAAGARAAELAALLEAARASLRGMEQERGDLHSKQMLLEEDLEASRLQVAELQQKLSLAAAAGAGTAAVAAGASAAGANGQLQRELEERKRAAEERAAQLEAVGRELSEVRSSLRQSEAERDALSAAVEEARRSSAAAQSRIQQLEEAARAREMQAVQLEQLQRDMAAAMLAAKQHSGAANSLGHHKDALEAQLSESRAAHAAEVAALGKQLEEAHALADYSSRELAGVVQSLAEAEAERSELGSKVAELREELASLRSGDSGELRARIEKLEKELVVTRNARDVNALFKAEHDRIANELIETKLLWAEAQEQIVKLKQALARAQEKNISFANKLSKLEVKFYKRLKPGDKDKRKKKGGSQDMEGSSN